MEHLRAGAVAMVWALALLLGTPGLDFIPKGDLLREEDRAEARSLYGPAAEIAIAAATVNREWRLPLVQRVEGIQRPFRIAQNWSLYRDGPHRVRRLEIWIDEELVHRSADSEHDWLTPQLRSRRVRPMVETTVMFPGARAKNWEGLSRFIVERATSEFPDAQRVELICSSDPFPGRARTAHHRIVALAPNWELTRE